MAIERCNGDRFKIIAKECTFVVEVFTKGSNEFVHRKCFVGVRERVFYIALECVDGLMQAGHAGSVFVRHLQEAVDDAVESGAEVLHGEADRLLLTVNGADSFYIGHDSRNKFRHGAGYAHVAATDAFVGNDVAWANAVYFAGNGNTHHEAIQGCVPGTNFRVDAPTLRSQ